MNGWLLDLLACPRCARRLAVRASGTPASGALQCPRCGPFPLVADVPILVPDPSGWCAAFRESALAALAEHGLASRAAVEVVESFAEASFAEPSRFGDDWTAHEREAAPPPEPVEGPARSAFDAFLSVASDQFPPRWLAARAQGPVVVEVGPGAGVLSAALCRKAERLLMLDLSLRAVLVARARAPRGTSAVAGADAEALPLQRRCADTIVAENVVDLLDDPRGFVRKAADSLSARGRLLLSTPAPELGLETSPLDEWLAEAGLTVTDSLDGAPWLRAHGPRHYELYFVRLLASSRARARRRAPKPRE